MNPSQPSSTPPAPRSRLALVLLMLVLGIGAGGLGTWWWLAVRPGASHPSADKQATAGGGEAAPQADHDKEAAVRTVRLTKEAVDRNRVILQGARSTVLPTGTEMPGEVQFDPTRVSHITPIVTGVAREVRANLGDHVEAGAVLAVIDSQEYGQAKSDYLDKEQMYLLAKSDHDRMGALHENTAKLLAVLMSEPPSSEIESRPHDLRIGEAKGRLLTAYATRQAARATLAREKEAASKKLATDAELQEAMKLLESAEADYRSAAESIAMANETAFVGTQSRLKVADAGLKVAERRLAMLGVGNEEMRRLRETPIGDITRCELRSPIAGFVVGKHLTIGERVSPDADPFVVVDTSTVWINAAANEHDLPFVKLGANAETVLSAFPTTRIAGKIVAIGGALDERTRTVTTSVAVENKDAKFKPGMFGRVIIASVDPGATERVVVSVEAVQTVDGHDVVFVAVNDGAESRGAVEFRMVPVVMGRRWGGDVEVLGGLEAKQRVVVEGSFILKAELGKGSAESED